MIFNEILKGLSGGTIKYEQPTDVQRMSDGIYLQGINHNPFCVAWLYQYRQYSSGSWSYDTSWGCYLKDADGNEILNEASFAGVLTSTMTMNYVDSSHGLDISFQVSSMANYLPLNPTEYYCFYTE